MPSREEFTRQVQALGANTTNTVTKRTTLVVVGDDPGATKIERARQLNKPTIYYPMLLYLGLLEPRGIYQLPDIDSDIITELAIIMATLAEDAYGQALAGHEHGTAGFELISIALESLLQAAYGQNSSSVPQGDAGHSGSPRSPIQDRLTTE
jgi:hypothetical protein